MKVVIAWIVLASLPFLQAARRPVRLLPVDEAPECSGFSAFRTELLDVVRTKDVDALMRVTDANVRLSFDDTRGHSELRLRWLNAGSGRDFWSEFKRVLELGGSCRDGVEFVAPYVHTAWPSGVDAYDHRALVSRNVPLRQRADPASPILTTLDHAIVRLIEPDAFEKPWLEVETPAGVRGYLPASAMRSAIDMRAYFSKTPAGWRLTTWIGGD